MKHNRINPVNDPQQHHTPYIIYQQANRIQIVMSSSLAIYKG